jgi:hypothetical protein
MSQQHSHLLIQVIVVNRYQVFLAIFGLSITGDF